MQLDQITPVILSWNEAPNIARTLERLRWAQRVIILDSGSDDETRQTAGQFDNVSWHERPFDNHADQWNHAVQLADTRWILSLDADYVLTEGFEAELEALQPEPECTAFMASFRYLVFGKPLRATILPPRAVLFKREQCDYYNDGHTQMLRFDGELGQLKSLIDHDDRKQLSRWLRNQDRYASLEANKISQTPKSELSRADRVRRMKWIAPWLVPMICLLRSGVFLDGWRGWYYALQRGLAETLLSLRLMENDET